MKTNKLRLGFTNISDKSLIPFAKGIIESMTNNSNFPTSVDLLKEVNTDYDDFMKSIPARNLRNSVNSAIKREKKIVLIKKLKSLGNLVEFVADGNMEMLESSGYELANKAQRKGELGAVNGITIGTNGVKKMVVIKCKSNDNASVYEVRVSTDNMTWNKFGTNNTRTVKVKELPVGEDLYLQMRMTNSQGDGTWSSSISFHIPKDNAVTALI